MGFSVTLQESWCQVMATRYKKGPRVGGQVITLTQSVLCKASCKHIDPGATAGVVVRRGGRGHLCWAYAVLQSVQRHGC